MKTALVVLLALMLSRSASAQQVATDPLHVTVALAGITLSTAGFALMLHTRPNGNSDSGWVTAGTFVVGAGVAMTYFGLRPSRPVVVAPLVTRQSIGIVGAVRWR